jgi:ribonuclease HII
MPIIVGIDENGYGPILGPLIVTSCVFSVPNPKDDLWYSLKEAVSKKKRGLENRLLVTDSKKAFNQATGIKHLERTTLSFLDQLNLEIDSFSRLLATVSMDANSQLRKYPWYPKVAEDLLFKKDIDATTKLSKNMKEQGIRLLDVRCNYFDVDKFNQRVQSTGNKAELVTSSVLEHIQSATALASFFNEKQIFVICDRIGGRVYYEEMLTKLSDFSLVSSNSGLEESEYKMCSEKTTLNIQFEVGADDTYFPVALSSMIGKYIREKVLQSMNKYFIELQPELKPTAGYYVDGLRFLKDVEEAGTLQKAGIKREDFVRVK